MCLFRLLLGQQVAAWERVVPLEEVAAQLPGEDQCAQSCWQLPTDGAAVLPFLACR